jgi:hypothetical protein
MSRQVLGIDFDNTLVSYDGVFHRAALDQGLITAEVGCGKDEVRGFLRAAGREDDWTALQGEVYGARMDLASLYDGALEAMGKLKAAGVVIRIISHKTKFPFKGPRYDLHEAARGFLAARAIAGGTDALLAPSDVFFELTIEEKLKRIASENCTVFIDDLPEILNHPAFPSGVRPVLFDPSDAHGAQGRLERLQSWRDALPLLARGQT